MDMNGALKAIGTATEPITLTGAVSQPGWWEGIVVGGAPSGSIELEHTTVAYGGQILANIVVVGGQAHITRSTISHSAKDGVYLTPDTGGAVITASRLTASRPASACVAAGAGVRPIRFGRSEGRQAATTSSASQSVKLPRLMSARLYSAQFVTRYRSFAFAGFSTCSTFRRPTASPFTLLSRPTAGFYGSPLTYATKPAASVSHDGEALYGALALATMEALAFVEHDLSRLLDAAARAIPPDSVIARLYSDLREWHAADGDWRRTRERIVEHYGYHIYGGNCHIVPNHALILLGLLYGADNFQRAMTIVNTSGWDTDCNAGNLGCLLGIRGGPAALEAGPDWRGPIADRLLLPTADGGRCITDVATEALYVANVGRRLAGLRPIAPKGGARFHFELPGSVQGFQPEDSIATRGVVSVENVAGNSSRGSRSLAFHYRHLAPGREARVATATFIPPGTPEMAVYELLASPTLYPGQTVRAWVSADQRNAGPVSCALSLRFYGPGDTPLSLAGPAVALAPGLAQQLAWPVPDLGGAPAIDVGVELRSDTRADGTVYLDALTWEGTPQVSFTRPLGGGTMWRRAWVDAVDQFDPMWPEPFRIVQNRGRGLLIQGTCEWADYAVQAAITPHLARAAGIAARVQGLQRYYALLLRAGGKLQLVKVLDGETVLAETAFPWALGAAYDLRLEVQGDELRAWAAAGPDGSAGAGPPLLVARDLQRALGGGGVALVVEEGRLATDAVSVGPLLAGL